MTTPYAPAAPLPQGTLGRGAIEPSDAELTASLTAALESFTETVNRALSAGFMVAPRFERVAGRLPGVADSYVAKVEMYRKLI